MGNGLASTQGKEDMMGMINSFDQMLPSTRPMSVKPPTDQANRHSQILDQLAGTDPGMDLSFQGPALDNIEEGKEEDSSEEEGFGGMNINQTERKMSVKGRGPPQRPAGQSMRQKLTTPRLVGNNEQESGQSENIEVTEAHESGNFSISQKPNESKSFAQAPRPEFSDHFDNQFSGDQKQAP